MQQLPEDRQAIDINEFNPTMTGSTETSIDDSGEDAVVQQLIDALEKIDRSVAGLHVVIRTSSARIAQLETYVAYLLSKDPKASAHIKSIEKALEADAERPESTGAQQ